MPNVELHGKSYDLPAAVVNELNKKGSASRLTVEQVTEKHPWTAPFAALGFVSVPSGASGFKQALKVTCQAGKVIETTSRFDGIDSRLPMRLDKGIAALRTYDYSGLESCTAEMTVATSDLFQRHLCDGCRGKLKAAAALEVKRLSKSNS